MLSIFRGLKIAPLRLLKTYGSRHCSHLHPLDSGSPVCPSAHAPPAWLDPRQGGRQGPTAAGVGGSQGQPGEGAAPPSLAGALAVPSTPCPMAVAAQGSSAGAAGWPFSLQSPDSSRFSAPLASCFLKEP